eukprot:792250-Pyramimonas_sp.AAC.2
MAIELLRCLDKKSTFLLMPKTVLHSVHNFQPLAADLVATVLMHHLHRSEASARLFTALDRWVLLRTITLR